MCVKGFMFRIYKNCTTHQQKTPNLKMGRELEQPCLQRGCMNGSVSQAMTEMQIKVTVSSRAHHSICITVNKSY